MVVQVSAQAPAFTSFEFIPRSGIAELYGSSVFSCLRSHQTVFRGDRTISHCTCYSAQGFQFLHFLSNTCYLLIFKNNNYNLHNLNYNRHPNDCEVVSQCGKTFRFLDVTFEMPERYSHGIVQ